MLKSYRYIYLYIGFFSVSSFLPLSFKHLLFDLLTFSSLNAFTGLEGFYVRVMVEGGVSLNADILEHINGSYPSSVDETTNQPSALPTTDNWRFSDGSNPDCLCGATQTRIYLITCPACPS